MGAKSGTNGAAMKPRKCPPGGSQFGHPPAVRKLVPLLFPRRYRSLLRARLDAIRSQGDPACYGPYFPTCLLKCLQDFLRGTHELDAEFRHIRIALAAVCGSVRSADQATAQSWRSASGRLPPAATCWAGFSCDHSSSNNSSNPCFSATLRASESSTFEPNDTKPTYWVSSVLT